MDVFRMAGRAGLGAALLWLLGWAGAAASELHVWRDATVAAKSEAGFTMMASRGGFAKKFGLNLEMLQMPGDPIMLKALLAGEIESYEASPGGAILAAARGADVKILGCYWPHSTHAVFVRAGIAKAEDLSGKTFAISAPGGLSDLLARLFLESHHMAPSEVRLVVLGSDANRYKGLVAGEVAAGVIAGEFGAVAQANGIRMLEGVNEFAPNWPNICTITSGAVLAARRDDAVRYVASEMVAQRYALSHKAETVALTREVTGMKPDNPRPEYFYDLVLREKAIDPTVPFPEKQLDWLQLQLVKLGNLPHPIDIARLGDESIRNDALALAAKP